MSQSRIQKKPLVEIDTFRCGHCGLQCHVRPGANPNNNVMIIRDKVKVPDLHGDFCRGCMQRICPRCAAKRQCRPLEAWLDRVERAGSIVDEYGLVRD